MRIYTDGSNRFNGQIDKQYGGCAAICVEANAIVATLGRFIPGATNNKAELEGIRLGLEYALGSGEARVSVYTDSMYCVNVVSGKHSATKNIELIAKIRHLVGQFESVQFRWVRGHNGNVFNEMADLVAKRCTLTKENSIGDTAMTVLDLYEKRAEKFEKLRDHKPRPGEVVTSKDEDIVVFIENRPNFKKEGEMMKVMYVNAAIDEECSGWYLTNDTKGLKCLILPNSQSTLLERYPTGAVTLRELRVVRMNKAKTALITELVT